MSGRIVFAGVIPHGAELLPAEGLLDETADTPLLVACKALAAEVVAAKPDVIIWIDPHATTTRQAMGLYAAPVLRGDLAAFGRPHVDFEVPTDLQVSQIILGLAKEVGLPLLIQDRYVRQPLSHGVIVPSQFLRAAGLPPRPIVVVTPSGQDLATHFEFGQVIGHAAQQCGRRVAILASGELSHRHATEPEAAAAFDQGITEAWAAADWATLMAADPTHAHAVEDCGVRTLATLLGVFRPEAIRPQLHHYAVVEGIGRMVAGLEILAHPEETVDDLRPLRDVATLAELAMEAIYCHTAKQEFVRAGGAVAAKYSGRQAGVFVTLYKEGEIRCSLGTVFPVQPNLCDEVIRTAIAVAFQDPRHPPVTRADLPKLTLTVQVVGPPEPIHALEDVDPKRFGLIAHTGYQMGVLLPGVAGVDDAQAQVAQVMAKAGVRAGEPMWLMRFGVETFNSWDAKPLTVPAR